MTIKEFCNNEPKCDNCSFKIICPEYECPGDYDYYSTDNINITKAIIETAKILKERGKWIHKKPRWIPSLSMTVHDAYECSKCGEPGIKYWHHCINCGSPMEVEDNQK